jgi:hypothetical protein
LVLQELNTELSLDFLAGLVAQLSFVVVGAIVAARRPGNAIGWLFCAIGLGTALAFAPNEYARYTFVTEPGALPAGAVVGWFSLWTWDLSLGLLFTFLLLLFPTGRLPSRRWRPVAWVAGGVVAAAAVSQALAPGPLGKDLSANPFGIQMAGGALELLGAVAYPVMVPLLVASVASQVVRFRRAQRVERQQLKWFTFGAALLALYVLVAVLLIDVLNLQVVDVYFGWLFAVVFSAIPVASGIAILRHHLYDIDRLINRTLVYGLLTVLLGVVYAGVVLVLGQLFGQDRSSLAVAGATLAAAAMFQPARHRVQQAVDRRFNRRRYDAARTVEAFSARLRDEVDLDTLAGELLAVANQTVEPTTVSLWLRPSDSVAQDQTDAARRQAFHSGPQRSRNGYQQSSAAPSISGRRAQPPTPAGRPNGDTWSSA